MYYELALISVLVAGGYWGWYFVRHDVTRLYGGLQLAAAALSGLGLLGRKLDESSLGVPGAIGAGAGMCLLVLGPLARGAARRFAAAERFSAAERMLDIADVLAPGSGVGDEKALLGAMREIRDGNIEQTVDALTAAKDRAPAEARLAIDERIAMLYLASYRWDEAIAHAEENLFGALPPSAGSEAPPVALRRALGVAPPVWVELLGAYGYKGDLDQAARMLARLEEVCAGRPDAGIWLHRGRMIFLALAGRVAAVRALVEPKRSRHMKPAARTYWVAVAHERQGEVAAAEAAYARARMRSRGRPRVLIDQALARLSTAKPAELGPDATELVARVEAEPPPAVIERMRPRGPVATRSLILVLISVAIAISVAFGQSSDVGVLMRAGAMVRGLVHDGEWWRLLTCIFVHVGGIHLVVNVIGLYFLGRLAEDVFGAWRTVAIFAIAGIGGSVASFLATPAGISAGASGAIFGLLGAVFIELTWYRAKHRSAWNRAVWGSLIVVAVAQLAIGFLYPVNDQWAHGGGLAAGTLAGMALSPNARWQTLAQHLARALTIVFVFAVGAAGVMAARTSIGDSLTNAPQVRHHVGTVTMTAPAAWQTSNDELYDPDLFIVLQAQRVPAAGSLAVQIDEYTKTEPERAKGRHFDQIDAATDELIQLPPGWQGSELVVSVADPLGGRQRYRVVVAGRQDANGIVLASMYMPETLARQAPAFFVKLLSTIE